MRKNAKSTLTSTSVEHSDNLKIFVVLSQIGRGTVTDQLHKNMVLITKDLRFRVVKLGVFLNTKKT